MKSDRKMHIGFVNLNHRDVLDVQHSNTVFLICTHDTYWCQWEQHMLWMRSLQGRCIVNKLLGFLGKFKYWIAFISSLQVTFTKGEYHALMEGQIWTGPFPVWQQWLLNFAVSLPWQEWKAAFRGRRFTSYALCTHTGTHTSPFPKYSLFP